MKTNVTSIFVLLACCSGSSWAAQDKAEFFESRIRPILVKHCCECHSVESGKSKGGFRLDSRAGWMVGGDSGPAIVPGKPDESHVILAINRSVEMSEMPPISRLSPQVISDFRKWIANGPLISFQLEAHDEHEQIACGTQTLRVIEAARLARRVEKKTQ